jgi:hypothetical protein
MSKFIYINGFPKLSAEYLRSFKTLRKYEPWELKFENEEKRIWLGGYYDKANYVEGIVTVELKGRKKNEPWVQVEQYQG